MEHDLGSVDTWAYHADLRHLDWGPKINDTADFRTIEISRGPISHNI